MRRQRGFKRSPSPRQHALRRIHRVPGRAVEVERRDFPLPFVAEDFASCPLELRSTLGVRFEIERIVMDDADKYAVAVEAVPAEHAARRHVAERRE